MLAPMIAAIGSVLAVLITALTSVWLFYRGKAIEHRRVNKAVLAEVHHLIHDVIPKHTKWWDDCTAPNARAHNLPLIPFTTPVYDEHAKNIGMLDEKVVADVATFYGYIAFLNSLQRSRDGYRKLRKMDKFVVTYKSSLETANDDFKVRFTTAFNSFGIGKKNGSSSGTPDDETDREKAILNLRRRWEIFDTTKRIRTQLPITLGGLLLAITGFTLNSESFPSSDLQRKTVSGGVFLLTGLAVALIFGIHKQYNFASNRIDEAYDIADMPGVTKGPELGKWIWLTTYLIIVGLGLLGALVLILEKKSCAS